MRIKSKEVFVHGLKKFRNGDFDVEDKERSERSQVYEDKELEDLLSEDSCQT